MKEQIALGALATLLAACGSSQARAPVEKPSGSSGGAAAEHGTMRAVELAQPIAPAATPDDLDVEVVAPSPIGALRPEHLGEYRVRVRVENRARHAVSLGDPVAIVSVMRGTEVLAGCGGSRVPLRAPATVAPGADFTTMVPLPCALPDAGEYDVVVVVVPHADDEVVSPHEVRRSVAARVVVDGERPAFAADRIPTAPIHSPGHDGLLPGPAPRDVRPIPEP